MSDTPYLLQVESTTACNAHCVMCPHQEVVQRPVMLETEVFLSVVDQAYDLGVRIIIPFIFGDPFCDPRMEDLIEEVVRRHPDVSLHLYTNGSRLTQDSIRRVLATRHVGTFVLSVQGGTKEVYERNTGLNWERLLRSFNDLVAVNKSLGKPSKVQVNMCVHSSTEGTWDDLRRVFAEADEVGGANFQNYSGLVKDEFGEAPNVGKPYLLCERAVHHIYVAATGDVIQCCLDVKHSAVYGNVKDSRLSDIWWGGRMAAMRLAHHQGRYAEIPVCAACNSCSFHG